MPFIEQSHRENPDLAIPGDLCYTFYKDMVELWRENPRWTTAHSLYRNVKEYVAGDPGPDRVAAIELAWQVFFNLHVMKYERRKRKTNGDV